ncbi:NACHT domain-containing protein [Sphingomonas sp. PP-CC-3A-396]|uniref:NACHT domain-containing protein n=1 Tax=Sphingomonas sp. PP-CC-3A-396 TaxID=2135655 RepID=UPI0010E3061B|nr:NACHT domain-containing protein [Sphingomonas sp. PP-CC-3A-396]TCQ06402.1 NACHT domain-containing protein [Sphingomonas sp. PP-CC-3A-396]
MATHSHSALPAAQPFVAAMKALPNTGDNGFEGFVSDCLQEVLQQRFLLQKSGHQGGSDGMNDPAGNRLSIGFEGKKYGSTTVSLAELRRKIYDAVQHHPTLDLWVLATTGKFSKTNLVELQKTGQELGIAIGLLDAIEGKGKPSALAILAAAAPAAVAKHLGSAAPVVDYLAAVAAEATFENRCAMVLEPFHRPDVGYFAAKEQAAGWLRRSFQDDQTAVSRLHCYGGLDAPGNVRVRRQAVIDAVSAWWSAGPVSPLALLGEEGVGKTWGLLAWWQEISGQPDALPLTIVAPARDLAPSPSEPPARLLGRLLADRIGLRDVDFWTRRVGLWTSLKTAKPSILLVIDGLNQNVNFLEWHRLLQPLLTELNGHVAVVVTCRTHYWNVDLKGLANLSPRASEMLVPDFSDTELDEMLARHHAPRAQLSTALIELMRVPRYCQLAIQRRRELEESGDITIERLIYEDWRHRLRLHGSSLGPTEADFQQFLIGEGERLRAAIDDDTDATASVTRAQIAEALGRESGAQGSELRTALDEIISGRWVEHVEGSTSRFRLKKDRMPFALALALNSQLDAAGSGHAERLAEFMEPLRGTDRGVAILRWAVTAAMLRDHGPSETFAVLAQDWFFQQNFGRTDYEALERLIPAKPDLFLDLAERIWLVHNRSARDENLFITAFADAARFVPFRRALEARLCRWLGYYWPDHQRVMMAERNASPEAARESVDAAIEGRRSSWEQVEPGLAGVLTATVARVETPEGIEREYGFLAGRAMGILSMLPRLPFLNAIMSWAVSRAISQSFGPHDGMGWVLRINPIDGEATASAISQVADTLLATGTEVAVEAAHLLLEALATPEAAAVVAGLDATPRRRIFGRVATVGDDGLVRLPEDGAARTDDEPLYRYSALKDLAYRPDVMLGPDQQDQLAEAADSTDALDVFSAGLSQGSGDFALEQSMPALARWAPDALTRLIRRIFETAPQRLDENGNVDEGKLLRLASEVERFWPLLDAETHAIFASVATPFIRREFGAGKSDGWLHAQISRLAGKTAAEQIAIFKSDPHGPNFYTDEVAVFATPTATDFGDLVSEITGDHREHWVGYVLSVDRSAMPPAFAEALMGAIATDTPTTRLRLLALARYDQNPVMLRAIVNSGWSWSPDMERSEGANGSLAMIVAARHLTVQDLEQRIDPLAWGARVQDAPDDGDALDHFEAVVLEGIATQSFPETVGAVPSWFDSKVAMRVLAEQRGDNLVAALDALLERGPEHAFGFGSFPVLSALRAVMETRPADGVRIWNVLYPAYRDSNWSSLEKFERLPFYSAAADLTPHCDRILADAVTDAALASMAGWAADGGRTDWLLGHMHSGLFAKTAGEVGRSLTLGRFLDPSPAGDEFWAAANALPLEGWLADVRRISSEAYQRSRSAEHWRTKFLSGNNPDLAFSALLLFMACADDRAIELLERAVEARGRDGLPSEEKAIWHAARHELERTAKESAKNRDKRLYLTDILKATHAPWRSHVRQFPV